MEKLIKYYCHYYYDDCDDDGDDDGNDDDDDDDDGDDDDGDNDDDDSGDDDTDADNGHDDDKDAAEYPCMTTRRKLWRAVRVKSQKIDPPVEPNTTCFRIKHEILCQNIEIRN